MVSAALHLGVLAALLIGIPPLGPAAPANGPVIVLQLVEVRGAPRPASRARTPPVHRDTGPAAQPSVAAAPASGNSVTNARATGPGVVPARPDARFVNQGPVYPPEAVADGEAGVVILRVHVGADGTVRGVDVARSSGHPPLDQAARRAVARWRYRPATRDGVPVASEVPLRVVFRLH